MKKKLSESEQNAIRKIDYIQGMLAGKLLREHPVFTDEIPLLNSALESIKATLEGY
jgi:hypothetical protein